jgi:hypothetical protein
MRLPKLQVYSLANQNRFYKKAAAFCLRAVARHSPELAQAVTDCGALDSMVTCLEDFDPGVKEGAAWALGYIAAHNAALAQQAVDAGAVPLLVLCVQEPELSLKRIAASALSDIAKHSPELAQAVVDAGAVAYLAPLVVNQDPKLKRQVRTRCARTLAASTYFACPGKPICTVVMPFLRIPCGSSMAMVPCSCWNRTLRAASAAYSLANKRFPCQDTEATVQVCCALAQVAKHSVDMAEVVVEAEIFPRILTCLQYPDELVRKHAATVVREVAKHSMELSQLVVGNGGVGTLVDYISESTGGARLPGIMALGYIAAFSETLALAVIAEKGLVPLVAAQVDEREDHIKAAAAWTLSQVGRHTPDHAKAVADTGVLLVLAALEADTASSEDLQTKARRALKAIVSKLTHLPALDALVHRDLPESIMKLVLEQLGKVLTNDAAGRAAFVHSGGLARLQQMAEQPGSKLAEAIAVINSSFPEEIVRYYSPTYSTQLLEKLDAMAAEAAA